MTQTQNALAILVLAAGCHSLGTREEIEMGRSVARRVRQEAELVRDPRVHEYVRGIGSAVLAAAGPQPFPYHFLVIEDRSVNAFSAPGGYVFLHSGALLAAESSLEVAALLAHEIGHVVERHGIERIDHAWAESQRWEARQAQHAIHGGPTEEPHQNPVYSEGFLSSFAREQELEADQFAAATLLRAGYCPDALVDMLDALDASLGRPIPHPYEEHPALSERATALRLQINHAGGCPKQAAPVVDPLPEIQKLLPDAQHRSLP